MTADALTRVVRELFLPKFVPSLSSAAFLGLRRWALKGDRLFAPNVIVLLTDGWSQTEVPIPVAVEDALGRGVDVFVVGFGGYRNYRELLELADARPDQIFQLPSVSNNTAEADGQVELTKRALLRRLDEIYRFKVCGRATRMPFPSFLPSWAWMGGGPAEPPTKEEMLSGMTRVTPEEAGSWESTSWETDGGACPDFACRSPALRADVVFLVDGSSPGLDQAAFLRQLTIASEIVEVAQALPSLMRPVMLRVSAVW